MGEEEPRVQMGAKPETRAGSLGDNLRSRSSHRGEQPIKASLARHKFDFPEAVLTDKFIMALSDAKDFVYGLDPFSGGSLLSEHGREHFAQSGAKPAGRREESLSGLGGGWRRRRAAFVPTRPDEVQR